MVPIMSVKISSRIVLGQYHTCNKILKTPQISKNKKKKNIFKKLHDYIILICFRKSQRNAIHLDFIILPNSE